MNVTIPQTMCYIIYHNNPILNVNPKTQARKKLIIYNTTNGITALRKHVNSNHLNILKKIEEEINCPLTENERQPSKKRLNVSSNSIFSFFIANEPFKKK